LTACGEEEDDETSGVVAQSNTAPAQPTAAQIPSADEACIICQMDITIAEMQDHVSALYNNPARKAEMLKTKHDVDSLNQLYSQLIAKFQNDVQRVQAECATKYNMEYEPDTAKRNALFAKFYVWYHNTSFPVFDTTGYVPVPKDGGYEVYDKGKTVIMSKAQHEAYLKNGLATKAKTKGIFEHETRSIASQITGIPEDKVDMVVIYVLGYLSLGYQLHPAAIKYKNSDKTYLEYMKIQKNMWGE